MDIKIPQTNSTTILDRIVKIKTEYLEKMKKALNKVRKEYKTEYKSFINKIEKETEEVKMEKKQRFWDFLTMILSISYAIFLLIMGK